MQLELTPFEIEFIYGKKKYSADVAQEIKGNVEVFTITHENKSIQIQSDRPFINSLPNSRKKAKFKAVNAKVNQQAFYETVIAAIQSHIYKIEHPPFDWSRHPKNI